MFLVTAVFVSTGLLTAQNARYEIINGKGTTAKSAKVSFEVSKSTRDDVATVVLKVLNNQGFQLLLDSEHLIVNKFRNGVYSGNYAALYNDSDYKIPEDAGPDFTNPSVITNGEGSVDIPEGIYDFMVLLPEDGILYLPLWAETFDPANGIYDRPLIDDYTFLAGYEYVLKIEVQSMVEFEVEYNASLTEMILPPVSTGLTNEEEVTVKLRNDGKHNFSNVNLSYKINNGTPVTEVYTGVVAPGNEITYTFNTKADFSAGGLYRVEAWVDYELDMSHWKDKITGYTKNIAPLSLPFVDNFDDQTSMLLWSIDNANNDNWTWEYATTIIDADGGRGSVSVSSPWVWDSEAGDDYLITDPIIIPESGTYNISFFSYCIAFPYDEVESLRILYGTSPNYEEMEVLEAYELAHPDWQINVKNFEIETPGNYYFAFHYNTEPQNFYGSLHLDRIRIAAGEFVDGPDIMFNKILAPLPACIIANGAIGAEVFNNGTVPITEFTLTYQVDEDTPVSETFYLFIGVRESVTVFFAETYTFPGMGDYVLTLTAETPGELEEFTANNVAETIVKVIPPITELPFERDFASAPDRADWNPAVPGGWAVNNSVGYHFYWAVWEGVPLLSRCVTLEPNLYHFTYSFSAGYDYWGTILRDDFYVTYGKSGTNPATWQPVKSYYDSFTDGRTEDSFFINITETDEYVFAFFPVRLSGTLRVFAASLALASEYDFRINEVVTPLSFAYVTPKYQVEGVKTYTAVIENRGQNATTGTVEVVCNGNVIGAKSFAFSNPGQIVNVDLEAAFTSLPLGWTSLAVNASIANGMSETIESVHLVSDSTFAWDNIDYYFTDGIGKNGIPCSLGLIYELQRDDILTSITLGLSEWPEELDPSTIFGIAVYHINDNLTLGSVVFETEYPRTYGNNDAGTTFSLPDVNLSKGKYFFEVRQLSEYNIAITYDEALGGFFYDNTDNVLSKISGFGYIYVRPNFGNPGVGIAPNNVSPAQLILYPNPSNGLLNVQLDGAKINRLAVYDALGKMVYSSANINDYLYKMNTKTLSSGLYFISVQTETGVLNSKFVVE